MSEQGAESSPFLGDTVIISYFQPLSAADIAPLVDRLGNHFIWVRSERAISPPQASPLLEFAAIALTFASGAVAKGFLEQMGKDAWQGVRAIIYGLYRKAKASALDPSFHAFALDTSVNGVPVTFRIASDSLSEAEFLRALEAARVAIAADMVGQEAEVWTKGEVRYVLEWDREIGMWRPMKVMASMGMLPGHLI